MLSHWNETWTHQSDVWIIKNINCWIYCFHSVNQRLQSLFYIILHYIFQTLILSSHSYICIFICMNMCLYMYTYILYVYMNMYIYLCAYIFTYIHTPRLFSWVTSMIIKYYFHLNRYVFFWPEYILHK